MNATDNPGRKRGVGRVAALVVVAVAAAAGIAIDQSASTPRVARVRTVGVADGPTVPPRSAVSVAWYCAEGTSTADGRAGETIIIGNLAEHPIDATITVMSGSDQAPVVRRRRVNTLAQARVAVSDILATPEPGVVVEVRGGPAVVEHELQSGDDLAVGPCAREPSARWYFAEGTTQRGAQEWLALFNPFGDDAIVDVSFLTDSGFQAPGPTQALVVPRRSRVSLAVHDQIPRQEDVAIAVRARTGRVVAERSSIFDGTDERIGLAVSLGVTGSARRWRIPYGDGQSGATESLSIANFRLLPTSAEVRVLLDGDAVLQANTVEVPARGVVRVDLASRVPTGTGFAVDVKVTRRADVVVEAAGTWTTSASVIGVASASASVTTAARWAFATGRVDADGDAVISALNVSGRPLTVQLTAYRAGDPSSPNRAPAQAVPPGKRATFRVSDLDISRNMVLVVEADGPIVAGREVLGAGGVGVSLAPGIPFRD